MPQGPELAETHSFDVTDRCESAMRPYFQIILALSVPCLTAAQSSFTDTAAFWNVAKTYPAGAPEDPGFTATTTRRYWIASDSLVNGEVWSVFVSEPTQNGGGPVQLERLVRQLGDIVVCLGDDQSTDTLYDFSLSVGDSFRYVVDGWDQAWLRVDELDSVVVQGEYRRTINFEEFVQPPSLLRERWIEGLGSIHGPLFPAAPITFMTEVPGDSLLLTCYGVDETVLWSHPNYVNCEVNVLLGLEDISLAPIHPYPNPGQDGFSLTPTSGTPKITVFDATGRCVLEQEPVRGRLTIDTSRWGAGSYQLVLRSEDGSSQGTRWIKQ
jgi:hypothetical protein